MPGRFHPTFLSCRVFPAAEVRQGCGVAPALPCACLSIDLCPEMSVPSLLTTIQSDLKAALKGGDRVRVGTLRYLISQIQYARIEKREELTDDDVLAVLSRQAKSRRESIEAYEQAGRDDLAAKERKELEVINGYLPEQLSEDEIRAALAAIVAEEAFSGMADMGRLMKLAMSRLRGRADGSLVSRLAKETLEDPAV